MTTPAGSCPSDWEERGKVRRRRKFLVPARAVLLWGAMAFFAMQIGLNVFMERKRPALRDPEFGFKLAFLQRRMADNPGQPMLLMLGSSRPALGFRPDVLRPKNLVVFNFCL